MQAREWLKGWAKVVFATEIAEFFEKNLRVLCGLPWHRLEETRAGVWLAHEIRHS